MSTATSWQPSSWRGFPIQQQPAYADARALESVLAQLRALPPLVAPTEVLSLRSQLAACTRGEAFLLQGGDCAESFDDCQGPRIEAKLKILLQMSLALTWGARMPTVRVGRIAGQYAKPRSSATETIDGVTLPSYRGDNVNGIAFTPASREPDPQRLLQAHFYAGSTLNYIRALVQGGFADLHHPQLWDLGFVQNNARRERYTAMVDQLVDAVAFMHSVGVGGDDALRTVDFFSSHEGLLLAAEEAYTREVEGRWFNVGAHMLWMGDRTRQLDGAHVEYFRGIENPIGIKVGPTMTVDGLLQLLERVEPENRPGRVTLITRFGADNVQTMLPPLLEAIKAEGRCVLWSSDPMHGNTIKTASGLKTRRVDDVMRELKRSFEAHIAAGTHLGGVHFELTGENVTECTGGPEEISEEDLAMCYQTFCDPRLNYAQSLEMALQIADRLRRDRRAR